MSKFYVTTPLYYVNARPHIGHAYTNVITDCIARYKRLKGDEVFFLTGTDEHGEKIKEAADDTSKEVKVFADDVVKNFKELWKTLDISNDFFIRTTDDFHEDITKKIITKLYEKGDVYKAKYKGFYCMPCETFWTDTQVKEASGLCPECKREVEEIEEENYFFKLSKYEGWLKDYLKDNPDFVQPKARHNEVVGFLENHSLEDLCISRPRSRCSWGIDFPLDSNYVVYVWFEALINYISAIGFLTDEKKFNKWWPADIHFMAKDILRHHAVFWPVMLKALDVPIPKIVFAHGWWKFEGEKMSKSRGNIVNPFDVVKQVGIDGLRYFLLREVPVGLDGNFSWAALINRVNSDLANDVGNLVYRTLNMAEKYFEGKISQKSKDIPKEFNVAFLEMKEKYSQCMERIELSAALEVVFKFISVMNKYIEDTKPWTLWKEKEVEKLEQFMYSLLEGIRCVAIYLYPFMPTTAQSIYRQLGLDFKEADLKKVEWAQVSKFTINKEKPLFPRIDVD